MQSTREPSCKSTYLTSWHLKGHSMSHCRSCFMMPHCSLASPILTALIQLSSTDMPRQLRGWTTTDARRRNAIWISITGSLWYCDCIRCSQIRQSNICLARKLMKQQGRSQRKLTKQEGWINVFVTEISCWYVIYSTTQLKPILGKLDGFVEHRNSKISRGMP